MNEMKSIFSAALMISAVFGAMALAGCPADNNDTGKAPGETCDLGTECASGLCEANVCVASCTDLSACGAGEDCVATADAAANFCKAISDCSAATDGAAYCTKQLGEAGYCDTTGAAPTCTAGAPQTDVYKYVLIRDVTAGEADPATVDECKPGQGDNGSDLFGLELLDSAGQTLGYAKTIQFVNGAEPDGANQFTDAAGVFDGSAPETQDVDVEGSTYACPPRTGDETRLKPENVVSLGCGGTLIVEFVDSASATVELASGQELFISEFAPVCNRTPANDATGSDKYDVYLCDANLDTTVGPDNCNIALKSGVAGGYQNVTVTIP